MQGGIRIFASVAASLAAIAASVPAIAGDTLSLAPSSAWHLDYAMDSCRMGRTFGEGDEKIALVIDRYQPGDPMFIALAGDPLKGRMNERVLMQFGPNEPRGAFDYTPGTYGDFGPALMLNGVRFRPYQWQVDQAEGRKRSNSESPQQTFDEPIHPEREAAIEWLAIEPRKGKRIVLKLGSMGEPMEAMRRCTDELLTHWGIDVERHRNLTRAVEPIGEVGKWIRSSDYPRGLLQKGAQGIIHFRLTTGADGRPMGCHIQMSTRPVGFDEAVCAALMRRAQFLPALDARGEPILSFWRSTARCEIAD